MSEPITFSKIDVALSSDPHAPAGRPAAGVPLRIAVIGDFSGRGAHAARPPGDPVRPIAVDRDNVEGVLARLSPAVQILSGSGTDADHLIRFAELDDFHPDQLYRRLAIFKTLRRLKKDLDDPRRCNAAVAEVRAWSAPEAPQPPKPEPDSRRAAPKAEPPEGGLLDAIIDGMDERPAPPEPFQDAPEWQAFLGRIVAPHLAAEPDPRVETVRRTLNAAISESMRQLLHTPGFQALESLWRGIRWLVTRLETGPDLALSLIDMSRRELDADLSRHDDLQRSALYRFFAPEHTPLSDEGPWSLIAGCFTFGPGRGDAAVLHRLATLCARMNLPCIAGADSRLFTREPLHRSTDPDQWTPGGDPEDRAAWDALRRTPAAGHIGLACPGFLLRLPYGEKTDPVELFDFEEMPDRPVHGHYLWGHPALACAWFLAQASLRQGKTGGIPALDGLPLHSYRDNGEARIQPCAEVLLTERAAGRILDAGIMPLLSYKNRDMVRLGRVQSIANPPAALPGPWLR